MAEKSPTKALKGRTVLLALLSFFGLIIGMNALMAWQAIETFDGAVDPEAYRSGLKFNDQIANIRAQNDLGWRAQIATAIKDEKRSTVLIEVQLRGADAAFLNGAKVTGELWRPTADEMDVSLKFIDMGQGRHVARADLPSWGRWQLRADLMRDGARASLREEVLLRP